MKGKQKKKKKKKKLIRGKEIFLMTTQHAGVARQRNSLHEYAGARTSRKEVWTDVAREWRFRYPRHRVSVERSPRRWLNDHFPPRQFTHLLSIEPLLRSPNLPSLPQPLPSLAHCLLALKICRSIVYRVRISEWKVILVIRPACHFGLCSWRWMDRWRLVDRGDVALRS